MLRDSFEWIIGLRYLRAKRSNHFIGVITFLSMGGIALGVTALIVVLGVMTGFKEEFQKQILGVSSHILIQSYSGTLYEYDQVAQIAAKVPGVVSAAPFILGQGMLMANGATTGVLVRGLDQREAQRITALTENLKVGRLEDMESFGIILGHDLATNLGLAHGDQVTLMIPVGNITVAGTTPRMKRFRVAGLFKTGMHDYDGSLAYITLQDAQRLYRQQDGVTGIEIQTVNPDTVQEIHETLNQRFQGQFWIRNWMEMNNHFFRALQLEKTAMFIILSLVVLVAAFNIVSSLIMVVMEKGKDIAILKTMGATSSSIMTIFVINGGIIGVVGTLIGLGAGLTLAHYVNDLIILLEQLLKVELMKHYIIPFLPVTVLVSDVVWITVCSLLISLLATLYPAYRAARVDPVETLRYE